MDGQSAGESSAQTGGAPWAGPPEESAVSGYADLIAYLLFEDGRHHRPSTNHPAKSAEARCTQSGAVVEVRTNFTIEPYYRRYDRRRPVDCVRQSKAMFGDAGRAGRRGLRCGPVAASAISPCGISRGADRGCTADPEAGWAPNVGATFNLAYFLAIGDEANLELRLLEVVRRGRVVIGRGSSGSNSWKLRNRHAPPRRSDP